MGVGITLETQVDIFIENLTDPLDKKLGWNFSLASPSLDRFISVSATYLAFLDNHSVTTMIIPERNNRRVGVSTLVDKISILTR